MLILHSRERKRAPLTGLPCGLDLRGGFFEGVRDRCLEAQRAAFASGGIPCLGPMTSAGRREEVRLQPGVDATLGSVVAVCVSSTDEGCRTSVVAVYRGDSGQAAKA